MDQPKYIGEATLPPEFEKIFARIQALRDYPSEPLLIEHIESSFQSLGKLHTQFDHHYRELIGRLLNCITELTPLSDQQPLRQRLRFLHSLLETSTSAIELDTLARGVGQLEREVRQLKNDLAASPAADAPKEILFVPPARPSGEQRASRPTPNDGFIPHDDSINPIYPHNVLAEKIKEISGDNERFGLLLKKVVSSLEDTSGPPRSDEPRAALHKYAEFLLKSHTRLGSQLEKAQCYLDMVRERNEIVDEELKRAKELSFTDELTGLPNRRAFVNRVEDELGRIQRHYAPLTIAIIDLDYFKTINDRYGHAAGDEILRCFAAQVTPVFRRYDFTARFGGEEFIVLLPNTAIDGAVRALRKAQNVAAKLSVEFNGIEIPMPTMSIGVTLHTADDSIGSFIERADYAMYRAKQLGRNRIETEAPGNTQS